MASSARNPKDLRQMVSASSNDIGDMQENLAKLRSLTADDKTEAALLRSRIDEQSQLIMILKQSSDESSNKMKTLDRINSELEQFRGEAESKLEYEIKKYNMLDSRFNDLADNHAELIKFKDEYKSQNEILRVENDRLRTDNAKLFSKAIEERDTVIAEMDKKMHHLKTQCVQLDQENKRLEHDLIEKTERCKNDIKQVQAKLNDSEERLKAALGKLNQQSSSSQAASTEAQNTIQKLTREKDEMLTLAMQRGKVIQEKGSENQKQQQRILELDKALREMELKFERESEMVNANAAVRKLRNDVEEAELNYNQVLRDFEAFKKHSADLLNKERDLNAKLRHLVG